MSSFQMGSILENHSVLPDKIPVLPVGFQCILGSPLPWDATHYLTMFSLVFISFTRPRVP